MKKSFLLLTALVLWCLPLIAGDVLPYEARQIAEQFFNTEQVERSVREGINPSSIVAQPYYVYNRVDDEGNKGYGFVLISGDNRIPPIFGYSSTGSFDADNMPSNVAAWMSGVEESINTIKNLSDSEVQMARAKTRSVTEREKIEPLIKTEWDQFVPYYFMCPDANGVDYNQLGYNKSDRCLTGCVATAMAQVMYYYKWPEECTSIPSYYYSWRGYSGTLDQLEPTAFMWDKMSLTYSSSSTGDGANAVAELMRYCGQSVEMMYGPLRAGGSGAYSDAIPGALINYFGYNKKAKYIQRNDSKYKSNIDLWEDLIYQELSEGRPVLYGADSSYGGHQFICDGYNENDEGEHFFHFNWGWGGEWDGEYLITYLDPAGYDFLYNHDAVIGIEPDKGESSESYISFADKKVENICLSNWDSNNDGKLSKAEAVAVTDLGEVFRENNEIISFNELQYFTGLGSIGDFAFYKCTSLASVSIPNSVASIGNYAFSSCKSLTCLPNLVGLESIGKYAFGACESITGQATFGDNLTTIGEYAFNGNRGLTSLTFGDSDVSIAPSAFQGCTELSTLKFGKGCMYSYRGSFDLTKINAVYISDIATWCKGSIGGLPSHHLFINGQEVTNLVIPDGVTSIGEGAFRNCSYVTSVSIPQSVTNIGEYAFDGTAWYNNQSDGLVYVGKFAYKYKGNMPVNTNINIKNGTVGIVASAFYDCSGLTSVTIPNSVTSIGSSAFSGCSCLASVSIPNSVTFIGSNAFYNCSGLTSVAIGSGVTSIGMMAFYNCSSLTEVNISDIVAWCNIDFDEGHGADSNPLYYAHHLILNGKEVTSLEIPSGVISIGNVAFYGCSNITSISIPESVISIGDYAFHKTGWLENQTDGLVYLGNFAYKYKGIMSANTDITIKDGVLGIVGGAFEGCTGLSSVNIPNSVLTIGRSAFSGCSSLASVTIPENVISIGDYAFYKCSSLNKVTSHIRIPFDIHSQAFNENAILYVPAGTMVLYKHTNGWKIFKQIQEMSGDAYAIFDSASGTLTFNYGVKPSGDNVYNADNTGISPGWKEYRTNLKKVVFDESFAYARPKSTYSWFSFSGEAEDDLFEEIVDIKYLNTSNVIDMSIMFNGCSCLTKLDLSNFSTENVIDMHGMFSSCSGLTKLDLSNFNTGNVTNMRGMFSSCSGLTNLDLSNFDTGNVTDMSVMFDHCTGLTSLNLANFNTNKVTNMNMMFRFCESLNILDLGDFNTCNVTDMTWMFYYSNMTSIYVGKKWNTEKVTNSDQMFFSCYNLVGGRGTKFDNSHLDCTYARIDGGESAPGYFTSSVNMGVLPLSGDASGDGFVNWADVNLVKEYIMTGIEPDGFIWENANTNDDNKIDAADIVNIVNIINSRSNGIEGEAVSLGGDDF